MPFTLPYKDRTEAGQALAQELARRGYGHGDDLLVLGLPRGGVPIAYEVARALRAPLDVFVVRKLGVPGHEELAMGAIASGGVRILDRTIVDMLNVPESAIDDVARAERAELERRERDYRGERPAPAVRGRTVILVDDGLATGSTMRAAVAALRRQAPSRVVVAAPVGAADSCEILRGEVDDVVCTATPEPFQAVGRWYDDFRQTTDDEVRDLLRRAGLGLGNTEDASGAGIAGSPRRVS